MNTLRRLKDIRNLDLFLFDGVPETQEPMYPADYYSHTGFRHTRSRIDGGKSTPDPDPESKSPPKSVRSFEIDEDGEVSVISN